MAQQQDDSTTSPDFDPSTSASPSPPRAAAARSAPGEGQEASLAASASCSPLPRRPKDRSVAEAVSPFSPQRVADARSRSPRRQPCRQDVHDAPAAAAADARGESRPQRQEASRSHKASRRPGVADARSMHRGRAHEQDDHRGSQSPRSRNSVTGGDGVAAAHSAGVRLTQPPVAIVQQEGRTFMPVPAYIDEPLPEEMPDSALAWDGERYSREEFCEYYGDAVLFYQAQQLTYFCRQYLSTWFDYSRQQEDHTALHLVLRLLKRQELRDNLALGDILLRYWYRAMVLRVEYLGAGPDGHLCTDAECQAMDRMVLQWAVDYDTGERPAMKARQLQRLYWQKWFGHKTLALTLAQNGVRHWMRTHLALQTVAQVHDSDAFRAAVARSRGEYTDDTHPFQPTTGEIGVWRARLS